VIALDPPIADAPARSILLGAYAARSCPVKTQNAFNPTVAPPQTEPSDALAELFEGGAQFEAVVLEKLITSNRGRVVDLRLLTAESRATRMQACVRAMESGAAVIIGGCLPLDLDGHRVGYPDVLIRGADSPSGEPAYHPAEVKWHKIIVRIRPEVEGEAPPAVRYSTLEHPAPTDAIELAGHGLRTGSRWADLLQLAHYHRMLESCGRAATPPLGAIIGTDTVTTAPVLAWAAMDQPMLRTFSRSRPEGWRLRSPLERYDHEHAFRVDIAAIAQRQSGHATSDPSLLVEPIVNAECPRCQWWQHCLPQLDPQDVSLRIDKGPLDMREIATLRRNGISTITDLVGADLDELMTWYLPEVTHRPGAEGRLRVAARRARMLLDGSSFARETDGSITVPDAEVEIDLDIESSAGGRTYLWGFRVQHGGAPNGIYHEFSRFDDLDDAAEAALAVEAFTWLRSMIDASASVAVYHYSGYETAIIRALADRAHDPVLDWAAEYAEEQFVDLLEIVKAHFFGVSGLGLKLIAKHAGFSWRDDDPGGLNSQLWFAEAVHGATPEVRAQARTRVLEYNEDDVSATSQLRAWLRAQ
jgi:predicted RecB family nuclease